jgi:dolichol kinase
MAFAMLGRTGGIILLVAVCVELVHLAFIGKGGLPVWRRLRSFGERTARFDPGPLFLALGAAPVLLFVDPPWSLAIVALPSLADSAAAVVGLSAGGPRLPGSSSKTVVGSATFFLVATTVGVLVGIRLHEAAVLGIVGVVVEWVSPRGSDNLLLPLAGLLTMCLLS